MARGTQFLGDKENALSSFGEKLESDSQVGIISDGAAYSFHSDVLRWLTL